jgi:hypothetical protein
MDSREDGVQGLILLGAAVALTLFVVGGSFIAASLFGSVDIQPTTLAGGF